MEMEYKISGEYRGGRAWWRRCGTIGIDRAVEQMQDRKKKRCGTTEMEKWVGRTATDWANIDRERLPTLGCIIATG